jgi:hypothetical protein
MLVSIEMNAIHAAGGCHTGSVEKLTPEIGADFFIRVAETGTPLLGTREFCGQDALWGADRRRAYNQNRRHRHLRLYGSLPDFVH